MEARGFSRKIIDNTFINNIEIKSKSKVRIFITSLYFADTGFDVALGREKGTDRAYAKPDEPTPERPNPHLKWIIGGKAFYSKGHWRDGVIAFYIIRDTIKEMKGHLQEEYNRALTNWYINNFSGDIKLAS